MTSQSKETRYLLNCTIFYYVSFIALGLAAGAMGPTLPGLAEHTLSSLKNISYVFVFRSFGYLLGALSSGHLYDHVKGHWMMAGGLCFTILALSSIPLVSHLWPLILVFFILGVAEGFIDVGGNTMLVWVHGQNVSRFMNGLHFFFGVGTFVAPLLVAQSMKWTGDTTWSYWGLAILGLPGVFGLLKLKSPPAPRVVQEQKSINPTFYPLIILVVLFFFFAVGYETGYGWWIYTYALKTGLSSDLSAAYLTSAYWGAYTLSRLLSIPLAGRLTARTILFADLLGCLISIMIIFSFNNSEVALWIGSIGMGFFVAPIFPTTLTLVSSRMPISGRVTSFFFASASISGMLFPWLIGQLFDASGPQSMITVILVTLGISIGIYFVLMIRTRQIPTFDQSAIH